jgi:hypothetical protein
MVSLKIPEPHTNTLGINKIAMAMLRINEGYKDVKVLNKAQTPLNEIKAKRTAVGK